MSLWGRLGPGVQGLSALFIAAAESNLCPMDAPQSLGREPPDDTLEGLGEEAWGCGSELPRRTPAASALGDNLIIAASERAEEAPQPSRLQTGTKAWVCK